METGRLTSETVAADPGGRNGQVTYSYDSVGNRTQLNSTLGGLLNYDANRHGGRPDLS